MIFANTAISADLMLLKKKIPRKGKISLDDFSQKSDWRIRKMSNWTSEQQTAIYERNCNLLVSAAAGSGKTAVLVERIVSRVLMNGIRLI